MSMVVGIDPGKQGGVSLLVEDHIATVEALPHFDGKIDSRKLYSWLELWDPDLVLIERQSIFKGQGGAMTIGANYGRILCVVELLELPHRETLPMAWNKAVGIKPGLTARAKKEASYAACVRTWGKAFTRLAIPKAKDGLYESLLIARYG